MADDRLTIAGREFRSRLWVGTGKYKDFVETKKAIEASGADVVTVAVRRVNITDRSKENLLDYIDPKKYTILPNTAGCYTVEDAVRYARLARAAGVSDLVKLEVIGDEKTLFPDTATSAIWPSGRSFRTNFPSRSAKSWLLMLFPGPWGFPSPSTSR